MIYDSHNWYWLDTSGRVFSSFRSAVISTDDEIYTAWLTAGGTPTPWPIGDDGAQTDASLGAVLAPCGIVVATALESIRAARIEALRAACGAVIIGGVVSDALGAPHLYPTDETAQRNLVGLVTRSRFGGAGWTCQFACADVGGDWAYRVHAPAQIQAAGVAVSDHIEAAMVKFDGLRNAVAAAPDIASVVAIVW